MPDTPTLIAHRGLCDGPNPERENHPDEITRTLERGFEAEIDVRIIDGRPWLGHDFGQHGTTFGFIADPRLWLHAKDLPTLSVLMRERYRNVFVHDQDEATLTSGGAIWTYPGKPLFAQSICVQPEWDANWRKGLKALTCAGICSKHVAEIREILACGGGVQ